MNRLSTLLMILLISIQTSYAGFVPIMMDDITIFVPTQTPLSTFKINSTPAGNAQLLTVQVDDPSVIASYAWKENNRLLSTSSQFNTASLSSGLHTLTLTLTTVDGQTLSQTITITTGVVSTGNYMLTAWNDLGMHCMDGNDFSVFSVLPP